MICYLYSSVKKKKSIMPLGIFLVCGEIRKRVNILDEKDTLSGSMSYAVFFEPLIMQGDEL